MSSFDISIDLNRLKHYHPYADAIAQLEEKKGNALTNYQFTVVTKYTTREDTEAFISKLIDLLTQYDFTEEFCAHDLMFFSTFIYNDIGRLDSQYKDITVAKNTLKSLIDIMRVQQDNSLNNIRIEVKGSIGDKAVITGSSFVNELLPAFINTLKTAVYSLTYNEQLAKFVENVEPNYNELLKVYEGLKLTKKRAYVQAISYNANLILNYLDNETHLIKGDAKNISDRQCQFIYDYLCLFEFLDDEYIDSLPKDYIRSMIESFDFSTI